MLKDDKDRMGYADGGYDLHKDFINSNDKFAKRMAEMYTADVKNTKDRDKAVEGYIRDKVKVAKTLGLDEFNKEYYEKEISKARREIDEENNPLLGTRQIKADGGSTQGQNKARELEGASGRTDNEFVQTDIFDLMADTDNTRDRTPRSGIDTEQQTIEQGRADISQSESSRQREDVANTNNNGHKGRCVETRNETPTRQDTQSEWRANSEIIGGQSNDGRDQEKSRVNEDLRRSRDDCSPKLTSSTGVCRLPTGADNNQRISGENRHQENNNRTLVSQGSKRFQSPKHRGLGKDKATLEANKVQSRDDIDRDKGMEEQKSNVSNTESKGLEGRIHSATISTERNESTHSGNIHSRERDNVADTNNQGVRTRINGSDDDLPKESGSRGDDRTTSTGDVGLHTKTTKNGEMGLSKERNPAFRERPILWDAEPSVGRVANGIPNRVHRLRCLGNSIVPQVVARIFYAIKEAENVKEV